MDGWIAQPKVVSEQGGGGGAFLGHMGSVIQWPQENGLGLAELSDSVAVIIMVSIMCWLLGKQLG